ncbi:hypothetical protein SMI01S_16710 [Sphingobacterium mizutaii NBRC 14946 = DSM 11724]|uniref:Uncharacterized protein n=1 Tax=Sphingobacterium mizutaii NBRC 14946 = DSM 11724 TaxID=1220576 RepID=A0ABQ0W6V3_9SPHI|nr:hypothetical protein SMI01S_16710 [Sphingobacterium mizutaii NBRC 14946 = DSM 11724]
MEINLFGLFYQFEGVRYDFHVIQGPLGIIEDKLDIVLKLVLDRRNEWEALDAGTTPGSPKIKYNKLIPGLT